MKCFNGDLISHQRFCVTEQIYVQPSGTSPNGGKKEKVPILPRKESPQQPSPRTVRKSAKLPRTPPSPPNDDDSSESESSESSVDQSSTDEAESVSEEIAENDNHEQGEEGDAVVEDDIVPEEEIPEEIKAQLRLNGRPGHVFTREEFNREVVKLRQCQIEKREYKWDVPLWVTRCPLRQTVRGCLLKEQGILDVRQDSDRNIMHNSYTENSTGDEVTESEIPAEILKQLELKGFKGYKFTREEFNREMLKLRECKIEKREYTWTIPEWILNSPLRPTERGRVILSNGCLEKPITKAGEIIGKGEIAWEKRKLASQHV
jgi:hypothetical protein